MATKIVTKNSSTASAVPTASDLVQGELAVNVADKRLFTEDNAGAIVELGTNPSTLTVTGEITANGGIALGDSDKATFGAGDDLEIYHDGTNNRLTFVSANTYIQTDGTIHFTDIGNSEKHFTINDNGAVDLYYDNSVKLATTSTGIDVTGTATMDGLTVTKASGDIATLEGSGTTSNVQANLVFNPVYDVNARIVSARDGSGLFSRIAFETGVDNTGNTIQRLNIGSHGDISFYEDTGTTPKLFWDASAESLGIGTSSPAFVLDVAHASDNGLARFTSGDADAYITIGDVNSTSAHNKIGVITHDMYFNTNGSERMRIDSSGNVGIGTASPATKLDFGVTGNGTQVINLRKSANSVAGLGINAEYGVRIAGPSDATAPVSFGSIAVADGVTFTERMRIDSSGNVGIGTSSPLNQLVISEGTGQHGIEFAAGTTSYIQAYDRATSDYGDLKIDAQTIAFGTDNGSERMRIDSSGNLLVGKTSTSTASRGLIIEDTGEVISTLPSGNTFLLHDTNAYKFYVNANGGIYNYSGNNVNLSDEREKKNIEPLESQWDSLKQWSLKKFHYNADGDSDNKKLGVIAQEVETHNPEVIDEFNVDDKTTRMAVKEQQMMWMAIKALQEAQTRIETLEARVTELENN